MFKPGTGEWERNAQPNGVNHYKSTQGDEEVYMLPSDLGLLNDRWTKYWAKQYSKNEELFFSDFAKAFSKLLHLGVERQDCPDPKDICKL